MPRAGAWRLRKWIPRKNMLRFLEILFQSGEVYRRAGPKGCVIAIVAVVVILAILAAVILLSE